MKSNETENPSPTATASVYQTHVTQHILHSYSFVSMMTMNVPVQSAFAAGPQPNKFRRNLFSETKSRASASKFSVSVRSQ
jgi:hypothetical protein